MQLVLFLEILLKLLRRQFNVFDVVVPAMCPLEQASTTACVSMIAPRALFTIRTPFFSFAILSLSNNPLRIDRIEVMISCERFTWKSTMKNSGFS